MSSSSPFSSEELIVRSVGRRDRIEALVLDHRREILHALGSVVIVLLFLGAIPPEDRFGFLIGAVLVASLVIIAPYRDEPE